MRISHVDLAKGAAQRLKALLPSLNGLPGSVQSELFIMYSSLKYMSMELERAGEASVAKLASADALHRALDELVQRQASEPRLAAFASQAQTAFVAPAANEPLSDHFVDVAALIDLLQACDLPAPVQEHVMTLLSAYLHQINQIDLSVYR